ncbi:nucleoside-diphosphate-sugar epimerase [Rhizobium freirei PRF 81]|uniref:Nucleoside-diphosphate-sugar epimerase n=1 Tax=Rhizobium freirei PRF 81 TaxID=363754 RepID=N6US64_9HYPH|nr:NmrA family NAD(P)-binding protein [Rhizobium freirei]ENN84535.1 nucleoside-diphosphate-sugar epimerase [Rhizobium freirei PRF 81]
MFVIDKSQPILVYLASGVQGGSVVRAALRRGFKVKALVRDRRRVPELATLGIELAEGDLRDPASLRAASSGIAHAVLQIPIGPQEDMRIQAENAVSASLACGLKSLVLKLASASRPAPCEEPSLVANAMIENVIRRSGLPFAIIRPTMYLDNLLKPSARMEIVNHGVFAPPIAESQRIAWTSTGDCARAAIALLERGIDAGDHRIAGPESVSGDELAARIGAGLGRHVAYRAQPLDEFERDVDAVMEPGTGKRVASKFRFFTSNPDEADAILARPFGPQPGLEDFQPTGIEEWVRAHRTAFFEGGV